MSTASATSGTEERALTSTRHQVCPLLFSQTATDMVIGLGGSYRDVWLQALCSYKRLQFTELYKDGPIYSFYGKYIFCLKYETIRIRFQFEIINRNEHPCCADVRTLRVTKNKGTSFNSVQDYGMRFL